MSKEIPIAYQVIYFDKMKTPVDCLTYVFPKHGVVDTLVGTQIELCQGQSRDALFDSKRAQIEEEYGELVDYRATLLRPEEASELQKCRERQNREDKFVDHLESLFPGTSLGILNVTTTLKDNII